MVSVNEPGFSVGIAAATVSDSTFEAVCWGFPLSWTVTVRLNAPATVGVPKSAPDVALIFMPLGWPETNQLYGVVPPVATTACCAAYPVPTMAVGGLSAVVVIESVGVAAVTVSDNTFEAVCCGLLASQTVTVRLNVPETVGVPKTAPEEELIPMPLG